jgi:hypothetical protein
MIIKILPHQVPKFWDAIKAGYQQTGGFPQQTFGPLANEMLHNLLTHKSQCWVILDKNRVLLGMAVTTVKYDKFSGNKYIFGDFIYAWEKSPPASWAEVWGLLCSFARQEGCKYIAAHAINERAKQFARQIGMTEAGTDFKMEL